MSGIAQTSTAPAVRTWLIEGVRERMPEGVRVTRTRPLPADMKGEHVWLGEAGSGTSEPHGLGPAPIPRKTVYIVEVVFAVRTQTVDEEAEARVFELFAELEAMLAEDPKPPIPGLVHMVLGPWDFSAEVPEGTPLVGVTATVQVTEHTTRLV